MKKRSETLTAKAMQALKKQWREQWKNIGDLGRRSRYGATCGVAPR
jgi:hypothetical protein